MFELLTVCTGNICRSPLAAELLRRELSPLRARVHSAGTRGMTDAPMTPETVALATRLGVSAHDASAHRSRFLTEAHLATPDLILTMTREHRRHVVELDPARVRTTFTVREFARLAGALSDADIREVAIAAGPTASARVRAAAMQVAGRRGTLPPPVDPIEDDVVDPYRRSLQTYELSAAQLTRAIGETVRIVRAALADL